MWVKYFVKLLHFVFNLVEIYGKELLFFYCEYHLYKKKKEGAFKTIFNRTSKTR